MSAEDKIKDAIKTDAERFCMVRKGRGWTHAEAYREGAKRMLELLKSAGLVLF